MNGLSLVSSEEKLEINTPARYGILLNFAKHLHILISFDPHENVMLFLLFYERGDMEAQEGPGCYPFYPSLLCS